MLDKFDEFCKKEVKKVVTSMLEEGASQGLTWQQALRHSQKMLETMALAMKISEVTFKPSKALQQNGGKPLRNNNNQT